MIGLKLTMAVAIVTIGFTGPAGQPPGAALPDPESVRHIPELAWHAMTGESDCTVTCWDQHESNEHIAVDGGSTNERGGGAHYPQAFEGLCADKHPGCTASEEEDLTSLTEQIRVAIQKHDVEGLRALLESQRGNAYVASERNALQIVGCRGDVVAHVRIPTSLRLTLAD